MSRLPDPQTLRALLDYDPDTGLFTWKVRGIDHWDRRWAGKPALIHSHNGYRIGTVAGVGGLLAHRVAWAWYHGAEPVGQIDHINGNRSDNRICNLRDVTALDQRRNAARPSHNSSGAVGVSWNKQKRRWKAFIHEGNRNKHVGYFREFSDAVAARKDAERLLGFHPNHGRSA